MELDKEAREAFPMDYGLLVAYDGVENTVLNNYIYKYPIGAMLCELGNVHFDEIKDCIVKCSLFDTKPTYDSVSNTLSELEEAFEEKFGIAAAVIITAELKDSSLDYVKSADNIDSALMELLQETDSKAFKLVFGNTPFNRIGFSNVGHVMLTSFYISINSLVLFYHILDSIATGDDEPIKSFPIFGDFMGTQDIDFRFVAMDDDIKALYTIKNAVSLLAFEFAHILHEDVIIRKCKNCGKYFVVTGRKDTVYCDNPSPGHEGKTCREIGAQVTRANKEKSDETTREYRKLYMRLKMQSNRHPKDDTLRDKVDKLVLEGKKSRDKLESGEITAEEYMEWLRNFDS